MNELTASRLRFVLHYDADHGAFTWVNPTSNRVASGSPAGCVGTGGYHHIRVDGTLYRAQRLAWLYSYWEWPKGQIDHINGLRLDNRLANLRDVSLAVNNQNRRSPRPDNATGLMGAMRTGKRWSAQIRANGQRLHLGMFDTAEEAHARYVEAKRELHAGCTI